MIRRALILLALAACAAPPRARAQAASSSLEDLRQRRLPTVEELDREMHAARYSLGPVRLLPRFEIRELGYDSNVFGSPDHPESDEVARVAAGIEAFLPAGRKLVLFADAVPEYDYYARHPELRQLGGLFRAGVFGLLRRVTLEARGTTERTLAQVSSEVLSTALRRRTGGEASAEVEILRRLGLVVEVSEERVRYSDVAGGSDFSFAALAALDRRDRTLRGGIRYHFTDDLQATALAEWSKADFDLPGNPRDNRSEAALLSVFTSRPALYVNLTGGYRRVRPAGAAAFPEFRGATGSFFAELWMPARRLGVQLYGHRGIDYGLFENVPYFREDRIGAGPGLRLGTRLELRLFAETGHNRYPEALPTAGGAAVRDDRIVELGGEISARTSRTLVLKLRASQTRYNSSFAGFDRRVFRLQSGLEWRESGLGQQGD